MFSNLEAGSFYTTEEQLYELYGKCGDIKRIVLGLDKFKNYVTRAYITRSRTRTASTSSSMSGT